VLKLLLFKSGALRQNVGDLPVLFAGAKAFFL